MQEAKGVKVERRTASIPSTPQFKKKIKKNDNSNRKWELNGTLVRKLTIKDNYWIKWICGLWFGPIRKKGFV